MLGVRWNVPVRAAAPPGSVRRAGRRRARARRRSRGSGDRAVANVGGLFFVLEIVFVEHGYVTRLSSFSFWDGRPEDRVSFWRPTPLLLAEFPAALGRRASGAASSVMTCSLSANDSGS